MWEWVEKATHHEEEQPHVFKHLNSDHYIQVKVSLNDEEEERVLVISDISKLKKIEI